MKIYPRAEWVNLLSKEIGVTKCLAMKILRTIGAETRRKIEAGEDVRLFGVGRISVVMDIPRTGRNRADGYSAIPIPAKKRIRFYPLKVLKQLAEKS